MNQIKKVIFSFFIFYIALFSGNFAKAALIDGLITYYDFEGSTTFVEDKVGDRDGTIYGGVTHVTGKVDNALEFNGSTGYVDLPTFDFGTGDWTISAWYKANDMTDYTHIFTADSQETFGCKIGRSGLSTHPYFFSSATGGVGTSSSALNLNQWYHLIYRRSGNTISVYVDGIYKTSNSYSSLDFAASGFKIGLEAVHSEYSDGIEDELGIWNRALTEDEILTLSTGATPFDNIPEPSALSLIILCLICYFGGRYKK